MPPAAEVPVVRPDRVTLVLIGVSAIVVLASLTARVVGYRWQVAYPDTEPLGAIALFDVNSEANVAAWWGAALLLLGAVTAALLAALTAERRLRRGWLVLAGALALLSLDEVAGLHERLGGVGAALADGRVHFAWILPGALGAAAGLAVLAVGLRRATRTTRRRLLVAAAVYLLGALVLEGLSGVVLMAWGDRAGYLLVTAAEETAEMLGACLALRALLHGLQVVGVGGGWAVHAETAYPGAAYPEATVGAGRPVTARRTAPRSRA